MPGPTEVAASAAGDDWADPFFAAYEACGNVTLAAKAAGVTRAAAYKRRKGDAGFDRRWAESSEVAADALEAEAWRRAVHGTDEPVFFKGEVVGSIKRYSDTLLMKLLSAHRPERFRDTAKVTLGGDPRNPVAVGGVHVVGTTESVFDRIDKLTEQFAERHQRPTLRTVLTPEIARSLSDDALRRVVAGQELTRDDLRAFSDEQLAAFDRAFAAEEAERLGLTAADVLAAERLEGEARRLGDGDGR